MKKQFLSILTALALCLTLLPTSALAEGTTEPEEALTDTCPFTIKKGNADAEVDTDYTWDDTAKKLTINTTDNLTISMADVQTTPATATIAAGKNESDQQIDLSLTLAGVNITGEGSNPALSTTGTLTITLADGTTNTLTGGSGGGNGIYANTLEISGTGTLQAQGTSNMNGIQIAQSVTITGGTVTATGGDSNGDGINFSGEETNRKVIISGGNVTATGKGTGKGIGGQAATFSTGTNGTAIIHVSSFGTSITKDNQLSGIIFEDKSGKVYGDQTLEENFTIASDETLTVPSGATLTIPEGTTLTNNGTLINNGKIIHDGGVTVGPFFVTGGTPDTDYTWDSENKTLTINNNTALTISMADGVTTPVPACITAKNTSQTMNPAYGPLNLTLNGVHITTQDGDNALGSDTLNTAALTGGVINLTLNGSNTLTGGGGNKNSFGIYAKGALNISGTGSLTATGGTTSGGESAGICSTSITITNGTVEAIGSSSSNNSFGIYAFNSIAAENPTITIKSGTVTATGGNAATASCGMSADGAITIENSTVTATGGTANNNSYGLRATNGNITITGGTGTAKINETSATNKGAMNKEPSFGSDANVGSKQAYTDTTMNWGPVPNITAQPTAQTVTAGNTATFTVTASGGENLTYQWQSSTDGTTWNNVGGATNATLTITGTTVGMNGTQYRCVVDNDYGSKTSDAVTLTVNAAPVTPPTEFTVKFDSQGGSAVADQTTTGGTLASLPTASRADYNFDGWFTAATGGTPVTTDTVFTEDTTVYAHWTAKPVTKYTVTFDSNGGSYVPSQTVEEGKTATEPDEPTMRGWRFRGWYLNGELYDFRTPVTGDITLVAKWSGGNSGGGNGGGNDSDTGNSGNGNSGVTEKNPDGSTTTTTEKKDGTVIEETKHPDGTEVTVETKPDGTVTEETKRPDGSTTVIEKQPDGTVTTTDKDKEGNKTEVVEKPDGSSTTTVEKVDGTITITVVEPDGTVISQVELTKKALEGKETVEIPMPALPTSADRETAPVVTLAVPKGVSVKVEVPVENPTPGTVAIIVHEDGREEIIKSSIATDNGVALTIAGSTTVKIVDNSKDFQDVAPTSWAADSVDFVTARELFSGVSQTDFAPAAPMTRQMLMTVLARLDGVDTTADPYGLGMTWAVGKNISDGSDPTGTISREELAVMLWRYAGSPMLADYEGLDQFTDVADLALWAQQAMVWAHAEGIITGTTDTTLNPQGEATRAQVAAMIQRYCEDK